MKTSSLVSILPLLIAAAPAPAGENGLVDTSRSPEAVMYMVDLDDVRWSDSGFWADRFKVLRESMIPYMWEIFQDEHGSHAWANFLLAAGLDDGRDGKHHGPPFNDGDFLKWFEGVANVYALTREPELDALMDRIIHVVGLAQREDGYLHTQNIIPERQGVASKAQFRDREHFETYNMGHLMTAACVHYRATGKTSMIKLAEKAADYLYNFYQASSPELARNAICPSHYMGVVELYRVTREPRYLELARQLIEIRDLVENGSDHNQDRVPFRDMHEAVGHAVRANYLYAGVADVHAEACDHTLMHTLEEIAEDVATQKLYITGMTGALYDGASPYASRKHGEIQLVHQAYGIDYQLPSKTAYNETCATIGYAMWNWRMFTLTGEARYVDLFEQSLYNGILPGISLDGTKYFYVNALQKIDAFDWPMRWSRVREPNIPSSFCCPPNVVRTIAEVQNYVYSLSNDTVWVNIYAGSSLDTELREGGRIRLAQSTDYPWDGRVVLRIDEAPERPLAIRLRIPAWATADGLAVAVNGEPAASPPVPGSYHAVTRVWKPGDTLELDMRLEPSFWESHPLVEETANHVAVKYGPLVYCLETPDVPEGTGLLDVALDPTRADFSYTLERDTIVNADVVNIRIQARRLNRSAWGAKDLYRPLDTGAPAPVETRWIPYFAWGNRGDHEMTVWVPLR